MFPLGKFFPAGIHNEGVVQIEGAGVGWNGEVPLAGIRNQLGKGNLPGGGIADVFAPDNVGDSFGKVVDAHGELVGPKTVPVSDGKVAALLLGVLGEIAESLVMPVNYFVWNYDAQAVGLATIDCFVAFAPRNDVRAFALINDFASFADGVFGLQLFAATGAGVNEPLGGKLVQDILEEVEMGALDAFAVVFETEPGQVFTDSVDVFFAGSALIVVFDAQVYFKVPFSCGSPYVKGGE